MRSYRIDVRGLAGVGAAAILLGCAPARAPEAGPAPPTAAAPKAAPEAPRSGGIFSYTSASINPHLHPHRTASVNTRYTPGPTYEALLVYKYDIGGDFRINFDAAPWLAERWESPNETTYLFTVRPGVRWHDGTEFTAADVAYTYQQLLDRNNAYPYRSRLEGVKEVVAVDKQTVRITTDGPTPMLLPNLADHNMFIMPKHVEERGDDLAKVAIGTGPMKLVSYDRQKGATWVKNEAYWQPGKPYVDGMEFHLIPDLPGRNAAFLAKAVDVRSPSDRRQMDDLLARVPDVGFATLMTDYGNSLFMRLDRPPFNDVRVRRAIHLAIDRQGLVKTASFGEGVISPPGMPGMKEGWAIPQEELLKLPGYRQPKDQDIAEAKRLLAEAGYPNGFKMTVLFPSTKQSTPKIIEPLASQLPAAGIEAALEGRPQTDVDKLHREGNIDSLFNTQGGDMSLRYQTDHLHSKGPLNKYGLSDPRIDRALDTVNRSLNAAERKKAALELQKILLEELYIIPSIEVPAYQAWHSYVKNYRYNIGISDIIDPQPIAELWLDVDQMPAERRVRR